MYKDWNEKHLSFWHCQYVLGEPKEGEKLHFASNLLNGFLQRMNEKVRRHSLGCFGIYGDEPKLDTNALVLWRGSELPVPMVEHPQFEYWNKTKLDVKNEKHQQLILDYLTTKEGKVDGRTVQTFNMYA